ncbi:MAG TPA: tetratricopeptide repeat protein [Kofleriaceae bacterium]|nr:tetratricopeptide repeat protein [Kofleriaceae bacterium]
MRAPRARIAMAAALAAVSLAAAGGTADARPKRRDAKAAFDRGVTAYQKGNYQGASDALGKSFELERDVDTLFAWAQAERKLEHCDKAIDLYEQLLTFNLPVANKTAVEGKLAECRTIVAQQASAPPVPAPSEPAAAPSSPAAASSSSPATAPPPTTVAAAGNPVDTQPAPAPTPATEGPPSYNLLKDPIALSLFGAGTVGLGVGIVFYASGVSEGNKVSNAPSINDARTHHDHEKSRKAAGFIIGGVGVACLGGGLVLTLLHRDSEEQRTVTGWLAPGGGGLAITGPF